MTVGALHPAVIHVRNGYCRWAVAPYEVGSTAPLSMAYNESSLQANATTRPQVLTTRESCTSFTFKCWLYVFGTDVFR